jgi:hypothetical protein
VMAALWAAQQFGLMERRVDTLWFALIGSTLTVVVGVVSSRIGGNTPDVQTGAAAQAYTADASH